MKSVFLLLLSIVCSFSPQSLFAVELGSEKMSLMGKNEIKANISGKHIDYVNIAFDDYLKSKGYANNRSDGLKNIHGNLRYYIFIIDENKDSIAVDIQYNQSLLRREKNIVVKGGDAKYYIKKGSKKIEKKCFINDNSTRGPVQNRTISSSD